jgi:hypothetical protein
MMTHLVRTTSILTLLAACGGEAPEDTDTVTWGEVSHVDDGTVCFGTVDIDTVSTLTVTASDCLSSSCTDNVEGSCAATVDGTDITLTSDLRWDEVTGGSVACTDDCGTAVTRCELEALPEGTYTVSFGSQTLTLDVPQAEDCGY